MTRPQLHQECGDINAQGEGGAPKLRVLDLFSGIGGFSLGLERTGGFVTTAFCEIDPFCRRVLAKHWPNVRQFEDVTKLRGEDVGPVDVICGGFPCQDISRANSVWSSRPGLQGSRSGLWSEFARLIRELRPRFVLVENVPDLCDDGLGVVLGDLAEVGYNAEWDCLPATLAGLRHPRERLWLVSYPSVERQEWEHGQGLPPWYTGGIFDGVARSAPQTSARQNRIPEPAIPRVVDGTPDRAHRRARTNAIGNAVVPQIPELIGAAILRMRDALDETNYREQLQHFLRGAA